MSTAASITAGSGQTFPSPIPVPPSSKADIEDVWAYLKPGLDLMMQQSTIAPAYYIALYTCVHGYCTRSGTEDGRTMGKHLYGQELYRHLERYFAAHVAALAPLAKSTDDEALLNAYARVFDDFNRGATRIDKLLGMLNRHWVKRERDEGKSAYQIHSLALATWQDIYLPLVQTDTSGLTSALLRLVDQARGDQRQLDTSAIASVLASLVEVDPEHPKKKPPRAKPRGVYATHFLDPMLAGTRSYYAAKSQASLINSPSVGEYVVEAEAWMVGEEERNKVCFEKDWERINGVCEDILIRTKLDELESEARRLMDQTPVDVPALDCLLAPVSRLLEHPGAFESVRQEWRKHGTDLSVADADLKQRTLDLFELASCPPAENEKEEEDPAPPSEKSKAT